MSRGLLSRPAQQYTPRPFKAHSSAKSAAAPHHVANQPLKGLTAAVLRPRKASQRYILRPLKGFQPRELGSFFGLSSTSRREPRYVVGSPRAHPAVALDRRVGGRHYRRRVESPLWCLVVDLYTPAAHGCIEALVVILRAVILVSIYINIYIIHTHTILHVDIWMY